MDALLSTIISAVLCMEYVKWNDLEIWYKLESSNLEDPNTDRLCESTSAPNDPGD
jgi:hypothetical protein